MIIWRGRGILVALIAFGCLLLTEVITRVSFHSDSYYQQNGCALLRRSEARTKVSSPRSITASSYSSVAMISTVRFIVNFD